MRTPGIGSLWSTLRGLRHHWRAADEQTVLSTQTFCQTSPRAEAHPVINSHKIHNCHVYINSETETRQRRREGNRKEIKEENKNTRTLKGAKFILKSLSFSLQHCLSLISSAGQLVAFCPSFIYFLEIALLISPSLSNGEARSSVDRFRVPRVLLEERHK